MAKGKRRGPTGLRKIPWIVKRTAARAFRRTPLGQALVVARLAKRALGAPSRPNSSAVQSVADATRKRNVQDLVRALRQHDPARAFAVLEQYAMSGDPQYQAIRSLLNTLGPIGSILGTMLPGGNSGREGFGGSLQAAMDVISAFSDRQDVLQSLTSILEGQGAKVIWPTDEPVKARGPSIPAGEHVDPDSVVDPSDFVNTIQRPDGLPSSSPSGRVEPAQPSNRAESGGGFVEVGEDGQRYKLPANHPAVTGDFINTPTSSNVHSFGFDLDTHTLYVRFKAQRRDVKEQGRGNQPGALYSYAHVPLELFLRMMNAGSKGTFIWDNIRIRGTLSGHRFDYALVGVANGYVPRKATLTPQGEAYISRSVFSDKGNRLRSSLPDQLVRPLAPPGRRPNNGRGGLHS